MCRTSALRFAAGFIAVLLFFHSLPPAPASALMASPQNMFRQANMEEFFTVRDIGKLRPFSQVDPIEVSISNIDMGYAQFTLIRFCHFENENLCPTAFFMDGIADENFYRRGFFPEKAAWNNRIAQFCGRCGKLSMLVFYGPEDFTNAAIFSPEGVFF